MAAHAVDGSQGEAIAVKEYPGRDSNPHATKAVALKATVSDQIPPPGRVVETLAIRTSAAKSHASDATVTN
jgi:hypothetical protein